MNGEEFKNRLKKLGLAKTSRAAEALGVSRFAIMHWKAGRRPIPKIVSIALGGIGAIQTLFIEDLLEGRKSK